jgi:hypothetical protein
LRGDDRADTGFVQQVGYERANVREDLALELVGLERCGFDPAGQ